MGYEFAHSIIDDHSRLAYTELHLDERGETVNAFVCRALAFFAELGVQPRRVQTDNAWCYTHNRALPELLARHGIRHRTIPPRKPKRNGKDRALALWPRTSARRLPTQSLIELPPMSLDAA